MQLSLSTLFFLIFTQIIYQKDSYPTQSKIQEQLNTLSTDTARISYLHTIAKQYPMELSSKKEKEIISFLAFKAMELSNHIHSVKHTFLALNLMQRSLITYQQYKKAQQYGLKILDLTKKVRDPELKAQMFNSVAISYFYQNDWKNYFEYQFKALRLFESLRMTSDVAKVYSALGKASYYTNDPKEGVHYNHKALDYYLSKGDNEKVADVYNDMGTLFMSQEGGSDSAIYYLNKSIQYARKGTDHNLLTTPQFNLAGIYVEQKKYKQALELVQSALETARKAENMNSFTLYSVGLSYVYTEMHQYKEAEEVLQNALKTSQVEGTPYLKIQIYKALNELYTQSGDAERNVEILHKYIALRDSVFNEEKAEAISQMKVEYETEKKEAQIHILEDSVRTRNWLMGISALAGLLAFGLFWGYWRAFRLQKQLRLQQQQSFEQQQENMKLEQQALQAQKDLAEQKNLTLQTEMEAKQRELTTATMFIQQKNELLESLQQQIREVSVNETNHKQIHQISQTIRRNMNFDDDWDKIKIHFEGVHPDFFEKLATTSLTDHELRHCAYIKMKFNPKEIASLLNIDVNSVRVSRYRIKKKLGLDAEQDLPDYISSI
ncbi:tetratricopeptide repeat protein [Xanthocytophaga agilis]|uniref:Tetratricopeptide repeat protein n=1 Tax=Xanthocytophaga agilis TaxID=3048010 RepID=A0AAE3RBV2_9BACT|nr:tetratricopeptide repeat protein [Xanthocytophaga agilis]MDJ1505294.1 tetratricopeptide repeat protein [Xanthocytophaga agilis]